MSHKQIFWIFVKFGICGMLTKTIGDVLYFLFSRGNSPSSNILAKIYNRPLLERLTYMLSITNLLHGLWGEANTAVHICNRSPHTMFSQQVLKEWNPWGGLVYLTSLIWLTIHTSLVVMHLCTLMIHKCLCYLAFVIITIFPSPLESPPFD